MAKVLHTAAPQDVVIDYLKAARKRHSQVELAKILEVDTRTIRRWEARQSEPPRYIIPALKQLVLPLIADQPEDGDFTFADLFAGIGGIRMAFEAVGGRCVYTSEWDSFAQKTYAANFPVSHQIGGDITQIDDHDIPDHDVLLAGFPCQPFSIAGVSKKNALGKKHGFADETQGTLFFDVARIIKAKQPRAFLLENVKNLQSHDKGRTFDVIKRTLTKTLGYHIHWKVIDAAHFVPQHRERILIAGFREPVGFDWAALQLPGKGTVKLAHILHKTNGSEPELPWDEGRYFNHAKQRVNEKYTLSDHLWTYLQNYAAKHRAKGNGFGFGLVTGKDISRTLSARYYKDGSEILIKQPRKNPRRLTPRECARLMGLPDTFRIPVSDTRAYQMLSKTAVAPMILEVAKLMSPYLLKEEMGRQMPQHAAVPNDIMSAGRWTRDQLKLGFYLYCQLPFGKLHSRNREIIELSKLIGRTPSAVAMKLVNFASLDPAITGTGRKGLGNASDADREIWAEFHADWERLATECVALRIALLDARKEAGIPDEQISLGEFEDYTGETKSTLIERRLNQSFFRRSVLSSYQGRCCMSGLAEPRLLLASHIVPWSKDKANRLNPRNGLCLSALHDRAFDSGLITLDDNFQIRVAGILRHRANMVPLREALLTLKGRQIDLPERFMPDKQFLVRHREEIFLGE